MAPTSRRLTATVIVALAAIAGPVHAEPLPAGGAPAAVGHAGAVVVAIDDPSALWLAPAGIARGGTQVALGSLWHELRATFTSSENFGSTPPSRGIDTSPPAALPTLGATFALGERVVVGASFQTVADESLSWPRPLATFDPAHDDRTLTPGRYAALSRRFQERGLAAGLALHLAPSLAVGMAGSLTRVSLAAEREIWGGLGAIDRIPELSPAYDLALAASVKGWCPGATASILWAPLDAPLELAFAARWSAASNLDGDVHAGASRGTAADGPLVTAELDTPSAHARLGQRLELHGGARFISRRWALELDAAFLGGGRLAEITLTGVAIHHSLGPRAPLLALPLGVTPIDQLGLAGALELDVVPGLITLTVGYGFTSGAVSAASRSPLAPGAGQHLLGLGATVRADRYVVELGGGIALAASTRIDPGSALVITPLAQGAVPAARGTLDVSTTIVGALVRASF